MSVCTEEKLVKKYKYRAVNLNGKRIEGVFLAENEDDLRAQLAKQNLFLVSAKVRSDKSPNAFFSVSGKVSVNELSTFCRQFAIMITSGTSIIDSLNVLRRQPYSGYLRSVLEIVYEDVKGGKLLSEAMAKHKRAFPNFFRSMVRVGEVSGAIDDVLLSVADYFEADSKLKAKLRSALVYPCILIVMAIAVLALMVGFIIPSFESALSKLNVDMPPLTIAIYDIGHFFTNNWKIIILVVVLLIGCWILFLMSKKGRYLWDKCKYHLPLVRGIVRNSVAARFCRAFSLLMGSGMDIVDAMGEVCIVFGNAYVAAQFRKAAEDVRQGMSFTTALQAYNLFPTMLVQMVSVGEKTAELDTVLGRSTSFFENQVERAITSITNLIQPVILVIIGGSVGVLFMAIYSPLLEVMNMDPTNNDPTNVLQAARLFLAQAPIFGR